VELEEKAKAAVYGNFSKEFPNLFKKLLESCYTFIKVIRSHFESNIMHSKHSGVLMSPGSQKDYDAMPSDSKQKGNQQQLKRTKTTQPQSMVRRTSKNQPQISVVSPVASPVVSPVLLKWRCFKCTFVNLKGDKCNMCGESKPIMYETVSSPTSTVKQTEDSRVKKWICTCCKFINASTNPECQMCRQPNALNQNSWICSYCSVSNKNTNPNLTAVIKCSNCDKSKPRGRSVSSPHLEKNPSFIGPPNILKNITNHNSMVQRTKSNASRKKIIPFGQATIALQNNYY